MLGEGVQHFPESAHDGKTFTIDQVQEFHGTNSESTDEGEQDGIWRRDIKKIKSYAENVTWVTVKNGKR